MLKFHQKQVFDNFFIPSHEKKIGSFLLILQLIELLHAITNERN